MDTIAHTGNEPRGEATQHRRHHAWQREVAGVNRAYMRQFALVSAMAAAHCSGWRWSALLTGLLTGSAVVAAVAGWPSAHALAFLMVLLPFALLWLEVMHVALRWRPFCLAHLQTRFGGHASYVTGLFAGLMAPPLTALIAATGIQVITPANVMCDTPWTPLPLLLISACLFTDLLLFSWTCFLAGHLGFIRTAFFLPIAWFIGGPVVGSVVRWRCYPGSSLSSLMSLDTTPTLDAVWTRFGGISFWTSAILVASCIAGLTWLVRDVEAG